MQATNKAVYLGCLMSPQEVEEATLVRTEIPTDVRKSWCLCGDVTDEFWCSLHANSNKDKGFRLSTFNTPSDTVYVIFTLQLRDMQSRFLLSLGDNKVIKLIEDGGTAGIWLSLGRNDGHQTILQPFLVSPKHLLPISVLAQRCKILARADAFIEFQLAAFVAQNPVTVPSAVPGFDVRQVSLSIIVPG